MKYEVKKEEDEDRVRKEMKCERERARRQETTHIRTRQLIKDANGVDELK